MIRLLLLLMVAGSLNLSACSTSGGKKQGERTERPKLILMVVLDQFRSDYLTRFESRFLPAKGEGGSVGGFRWLLENGAVYPYGEYDLLQAMTGPGHASISTGSYPYLMGIPSNYWYSDERKQKTYCVEDDRHQVVGVPENVARTMKHTGTSPRNLLGTTLGDELKNAGYPSRIIAIALKDRSAILMGGHRADLALWFDPKSFQWISSDYYLPSKELPGWVKELNGGISKRKGSRLKWNAPGDQTGFSARDAMPLEGDWNSGALGGKEFPHELKLEGYAGLSTPFGTEITVDAAIRALKEYRLGHGEATDVLAVSISGHDYLGHAFGPNSRQMEEMTVSEDRELSRLLSAVRKGLPRGLDDAVIVLTGDHGVAPNPDWLTAQKIPAGRISEDAATQAIQSALSRRFGSAGRAGWVAYTKDLGFWLNEEALGRLRVERAEVEEAAKEALLKLSGVAYVFSSTDWQRRMLPPGMLRRQITHTFFPGRSADLTVIPKPFFITEGATTDHLTGYAYDRMVPIILSGKAFRKGRYAQKAQVIDIAPTLSFVTGSLPPALTEGRVLSEALE